MCNTPDIRVLKNQCSKNATLAAFPLKKGNRTCISKTNFLRNKCKGIHRGVYTYTRGDLNALEVFP